MTEQFAVAISCPALDLSLGYEDSLDVVEPGALAGHSVVAVRRDVKRDRHGADGHVGSGLGLAPEGLADGNRGVSRSERRLSNGDSAQRRALRDTRL